MIQNRRSFMKQVGLVGLSIPIISCAKTLSSTTGNFTLNKYGIQLWSVRDDMKNDPKATLKALSQYGYNQIESFQGESGVFWGMTAKEFNEYTKSLGLNVISSHCNPQYTLDPTKLDEFKKLADDAASIGIKHLVNPYMAFLKSKDDFKRATDGMNVCGKICKERGLKYAYHNHNYSFKLWDGEYPQDIMMKGSDPDSVDFEMDIYWVVAAEQDPIAWLKKYSGRFKLCHIKDRYKQAQLDAFAKTEKVDPSMGVNGSCVLGTGQIDFPKILQVAKDHGMMQYIVEQERWENSTPMKDAEKDATYMKKFLS